MQEQGSRALQWKCFLGLVSPDPATWADDVQVRRQYYNAVLEAYADVQLRNVSAGWGTGGVCGGSGGLCCLRACVPVG
jgi:hypothetical protein